MTIETVLIVGAGLIGSSIARAIRAEGLAKTIYMNDRSSSVCAAVETLGIADGVSEHVADYYASQADIVILCVPPGKMGDAAERIVPHMKAGAILSDVGSVKSAIINNVTSHLREDIQFCSCSPDCRYGIFRA